MAIKLTSKPNITGPNATYPRGNIKDKVVGTPGSPGTPVNVLVYGDMHQFFEKMAADAGITLNDLPDNETNGYQFFDSLLKVNNPDFTSTGIVFSTISGNTWANLAASGLNNIAYKKSRNEVSLCGAASISSVGVPGDIPILTLPTGARPAKKVLLITRVVRNTTSTIEQIIVETTGEVRVTNGVGTFAPCTVYLDGLQFRIS